ncbi:hypothetical protein V491_08954 [Pseudogymnoascus sp. VKM F-3775]|nr:hypothetical protein V491_08954 [Pseudogymnoascus sp. VKM F-3775]
MPPNKPSKGRHSASRHRHTLSLQKTEVMINVYDLLPPGKFSTVLWAIGSSLLHSGIVINGKEYAYGGHDKRGMTGVYWTRPRSEPPGGTFKCEVLQGFTLAPAEEIEAIIKAASEEFQGTSYNILTRNCNHFTSYLCEKLTGRPGPSWLNRAASIGIALPCVVPKEWIAPPDYDTADGELIDGDEDDTNESSRMLPTRQYRRSFGDSETVDGTDVDEWENDRERRNGSKGKGKALIRDTSGRVMPPAERAPLPRGI